MRKPLERHTFKTYSSPRLRFALCDPDGVPFVIAHTPALCFEQYVDMRGGVITDRNAEEAYFASMVRRKWTLRHIETNVTVGSEIESIKSYRKVQREEAKKDEVATEENAKVVHQEKAAAEKSRGPQKTKARASRSARTT